MRRLRDVLPANVTRTVRAWSWATWAAQILIVVTGGAVRLTASGLGCPTWPSCTDDSLVSTPEMGIHGFIEFANRLLTFALVIVAIATFLSVVRLRKSRRDLFWLTLVIGLGIPAQAVIGGISVLTQLNPYVVGLHFVVSVVMVVLSTTLVLRTREFSPVRMASHSDRLLVAGVWVVAIFQTITVLIGILVTGSGPHAGDADAPRNGLNSELWQHFHAVPAYAALASTVLVLIVAVTSNLRNVARVALAVVLVNFAQVAVGLAQANLGLPAILVGIHMLLACLIVSATTWLLFIARRS